jgi:hypothetical protein
MKSVSTCVVICPKINALEGQTVKGEIASLLLAIVKFTLPLNGSKGSQRFEGDHLNGSKASKDCGLYNSDFAVAE